MLDNTNTSETTFFTFDLNDKFTYIVDQLANEANISKDANKAKKGLMLDALTELQDMERANVSLSTVKVAIFEANKWNYKEEDATTGKQVIHNFGKGSNAQAKAYQDNGLRFVNAINWQKVVEGGKKVDKLVDVKNQVKALVKAAKSIEDNAEEVAALAINLKSITNRLENA